MGPTRRIAPTADTFFYGRRFACRGERLLTTGAMGAQHTLCAWDTGAWAPIWTAPIRTSTSFFVAHDGTWVVTRDPDRVSLWNMTDGKQRATFTPSIDVRVALAGGRLGALVEDGSQLAILDAETGKIESQFALQRKAADLVAVPDGQHVVAIDAFPGSVGFTLLAQDGRLLSSFAGSGADILFRPGASELVLAGSSADDFLPVVFDARGGARVAVLGGARKSVAACHASAISPDGRWLATVHADERDNHWIEDQQLFIWDLEARRLHRTVELDCYRYPNAATFVGDSLVVVAAERTLDVWEVRIEG